MTTGLSEDLRRRFRETTRVRIAEMAVLLAALEEDATTRDALERLATHFHALAGMGATYGFPRISELGDEGEATIHPLVRDKGLPDEATVARWRMVIAGIERALEETPGTNAGPADA